MSNDGSCFNGHSNIMNHDEFQLNDGGSIMMMDYDNQSLYAFSPSIPWTNWQDAGSLIL